MSGGPIRTPGLARVVAAFLLAGSVTAVGEAAVPPARPSAPPAGSLAPGIGEAGSVLRVPARGARGAAIRKWMAERRRLHAWLEALRREIGVLQRAASVADDAAEKRRLLALVRERKSDMTALRWRLTVLGRRLREGALR